MISRTPSRTAFARRQTRKVLSCFLRAAAGFGVCLGLSGTAWAYSLEGYSWPTPTVPIRVQLGPSSITLADGSTTWDAVVENALALWNEQMAGTQFTSTEAPPGTAASAGDGINSMQFASTIYGDKFDAAKLKALPAGSFYTEPANVSHFSQIKGDGVVVQIVGNGPTATRFVDPADAPKK